MTPVAPACVTTKVLLTVWVGSEKVPKPTKNPLPAEQQWQGHNRIGRFRKPQAGKSLQ